jgi:hypothetical protein
MHVKSAMSIDERLAALKNMLVIEDDFSGTCKYFFDHLGYNENFMRLGKVIKNQNVKQIMKSIGKSFLGKEVSVTKLSLMSFPKYRFTHGLCQIDGNITAFFLFREINMGMASMVDTSGRQDISLYARFTTFEFPNKSIYLQSLSGPSLH